MPFAFAAQRVDDRAELQKATELVLRGRAGCEVCRRKRDVCGSRGVCFNETGHLCGLRATSLLNRSVAKARPLPNLREG